MNVRDFFGSVKSFADIVSTLEELASDASADSIHSLVQFLQVKDPHTYDKTETVVLVCLGLLTKGTDGLAALESAIPICAGPTYRNRIIECLWMAAMKKQIRTSHYPLESLPKVFTVTVDDEMAKRAAAIFDNFVSDSLHDMVLFDALIQFLFLRSYTSSSEESEKHSLIERIRHVFTESSIRITQSIIEEFEELILGERAEEVYQVFLSKHPVLLDPLACRIIPKHPLGIEYKTDYVIQRLDGEYFVVEIEKPTDSIFTKANDFTASFTHAIGQVLDFQEWVESNGEYARRHLPGVRSPRGILVMGRGNTLDPQQTAKLNRYRINMRNIEILTYDDVLSRSKSLYENIRHRGLQQT